MSKGFTKKQIAACEKEFRSVRDAILAAGGIKNDAYAAYEFSIETVCGRLDISPNPGTHIHSIFTRFSDVDRAKFFFRDRSPGIQPNPYSGKWNFHGGDSHYLAADFLGEFVKIKNSH